MLHSLISCLLSESCLTLRISGRLFNFHERHAEGASDGCRCEELLVSASEPSCKVVEAIELAFALR
jgi:hypothetical protein